MPAPRGTPTSWDITLTCTRSLTAPIKNALITIFGAYNIDPNVVTVWSVISHETTDCSGVMHWTFTGPDIHQVCIVWGIWNVNPSYDSTIGENSDNRHFLKDTGYPEYRCDISNNFYNSVIVTSGPSEPINDIYDFPYLFDDYNLICSIVDDEGTTFAISVQMASGGAGTVNTPAQIIASANGLYYDVTDVFLSLPGHSVSLTDSCGSTGSMVLNTWRDQNYVLQRLWSFPSTIDWFLLASVTVTGTLTHDQVLTGGGNTDRSAFRHPPSTCQSHIMGEGYLIYPDASYFTTTEKAHVNDRIGPPYGLYIYIGDFSILTPTPESTRRVAASFRSMVVYAWISGSGALKVSSHRRMHKRYGNTDGWIAVQTLAPDSVTYVSIVFMHNGWCYLQAVVGSSISYWVSKDFGTTWTTSMLGLGFAACDQGQGMTAGVKMVIGPSAGRVYLHQIRDNLGYASISQPLTVVSGVYVDSFAGIAWVESGWVAMWNSNVIETAFIQGWPLVDAGTGTNIVVRHATGLSGDRIRAVGMCRGQAGSLVMLLYDAATQQSRLAWSGDRGVTWTQQDALIATALIPALVTPPTIVHLEGGMAAICWHESDVPKFRLTLDGGRTVA